MPRHWIQVHAVKLDGTTSARDWRHTLYVRPSECCVLIAISPFPYDIPCLAVATDCCCSSQNYLVYDLAFACLCVCVHMYVHACRCIHLRMCMNEHAHGCMVMYSRVYAYVCVWLCLPMWNDGYGWIWMSMCAYGELKQT